MNEPVTLVGRLLPAVGRLERGGTLWRRRRLRLDRIQQGAQGEHASGSQAGTGAHPEHRPACEVRHDRNNAAPIAALPAEPRRIGSIV